MSNLRIGTRGSKLALWQAEWVANQLRSIGYEVRIQIISTHGDVATQPLGQVGGQGLFTKEIQRELLADRVDVAVHSLKDLPTQPVDGLHLAAVPERETTADVLVSRSGDSFEELVAGARVGTGSTRRAAQLRRWRSDISVLDIRGNVDSRLAKLEAGHYDAIVLAAAGMTRLGLSGRISQVLPVERMLPAVGQGALGLECRKSDVKTSDALSKLNHHASFAEIVAERTLLLRLLAGCLAPVAARAVMAGDRLELSARVLSLDGQQIIEGRVARCADEGQTSPTVTQATELGEELANDLLDRGAADLIAAIRKS